ncbi:MAG: group II intron reverse transcriptase/maturase, partial [Armatimonadota bacterium]
MSISVNTGVILDMQRKLYCWSRNDRSKVFSDLFNLVCDTRTLAFAWDRLRRNAGSRTPGIDGVTSRKIERRPDGVAEFLIGIREELRQGTYTPQPVRQRLIPKPGKPGKFRPLGIPTLKDRLVQMALKIVLEPIFEADFYPTSYGFRRGRSTHDALAMIQQQLLPNRYGSAKAEYIIEGDIKGCFDNIDHHILMEGVRKRIKDKKVLRLILAFLKAGIMAEGSVRHPIAGTPQGGIISPLLANIHLSRLDERYRRWIPSPDEVSSHKPHNRRGYDRRHGRPTFFIVRYADDFVILVSGTREEAEAEKAALTTYLRDELKMELSQEKTLITRAEDGITFLGYRVVKEKSKQTGRMVGKLFIPKDKLQMLRTKLKQETCNSQIGKPMDGILKTLNPIITGWRNYYQYATGAAGEFSKLDWWLWCRVRLWAKKKHRKATSHRIRRLYSRQLTPTRTTWGGEKLVLRS